MLTSNNISKRVCRLLGLFLITGIVSLGCQTSSFEKPLDFKDVPDPPKEPAPEGKMRSRTVYVPAYSHLPQRKKPHKNQLSILLSVRNVDSSADIELTHVEYFDTYGHRVRRYLDEPRKLRPLETAEFIVDPKDDAGGSGANFLVYWNGPSDAHSLLTEAVMWGFMGQGYVSFTSRGVELDRRPDTENFTDDCKPVDEAQ